MAKKELRKIKLHIPAGQANPAPPVGPALGQYGVNIMEFCNDFNSKTKDQQGMIIPVEITVYSDRSFKYITKAPTVSILLKKAAGIIKGSGEPNRTKVGSITSEQVKDIARIKLADFNTTDLSAAINTVSGTARSIGIEITGNQII